MGHLVRRIYNIISLYKFVLRIQNKSSLSTSSLDVVPDEFFALAGPNSNSKQKAGPHIDLPFFPTLSKSPTVNCNISETVR
jgi:DNA polymerase II small subunit/DNA polymerase delta subunit B